MDKFYFSNVDISPYWKIYRSLKVVLIPSDWWNVKSWKLAFEFNNNVECVYLGHRRSSEKDK